MEEKQEQKFVDFIVKDFPGVYSIAGKEQKGFRLTFDFNELCDAETVTGFNLLSPLKNLAAMSAGQMRGIAFSLLKTAHPKITLKEAGDLLSKDGPAVTAAVYKALDAESGEDALFLALSQMAAERPLELVTLLSRIKTPTPPVEEEASAPQNAE